MKYNLHDCVLDSITIEQDSIIFSFPDGFYIADETGHWTSTGQAKLAFVIDCDNTSPESCIFIRRINLRRNRWKDISFRQFSALFEEGNMVIYDEFDSKLVNKKMFQLNCCTRWSNIELFIEDIKDIVYLPHSE